MDNRQPSTKPVNAFSESSESPSDQTPGESSEVHTLPEKFLRPQQRSKTHHPLSPIRIALIAVSVVVVLLVVGSYLLLTVFDKQTELVNETVNTANENLNIPLVNAPSASNEKLNGSENVNSGNMNGNENLNVSIIENLNSGNLNVNTPIENQNANINANTNRSTNTNSNGTTVIASTQDTDEDGLTDQEEAVYGTNDAIKDTDGDGFVDGLEVMNGYSPLLIPGTRIANTAEVSIYSNLTHTFSVDHPSNWIVDARTPNEILFVTATTEFVEVLIEEKRSAQSIGDWYDEQVSTGGASELTVTTINGLEALVAKNGLTYYMGDEDKVFVVTYNYGTREKVNYRTSFYMMVSSFMREIVQEEDANLNSNQNLNINSRTNQNSNLNKNANKNANQNANINKNINANKNTNQ